MYRTNDEELNEQKQSDQIVKKTDIKKDNSFIIVMIPVIISIICLTSYALLLKYGNFYDIKLLREGNMSDVDIDTIIYALSSILIAGTVCSALISLASKYDIYKDIHIIKMFNSFKSEVVFALFPVLLYFLLVFIDDSFIYVIGEEAYINTFFTPYSSVPYFALGIPVFSVVLLFVYLITFRFKHVYYYGFMHSVYTNSFYGELLRIYQRRIQNLKDANRYNNLETSAHIRYLIYLAFLLIYPFIAIDNRILITLFPIISVIPLIFMYRIERNIVYLEQETKKISEVNYHGKIDENLGVLSGVAKGINLISEDFQRAVKEEVKMQNINTELIANVSHDLKTPLTGIINYADLIANNNISDEKIREYANVIFERSIRLKYLIEDLFELSVTSSGDIVLDLDNLDIINLLHQSLGEMEKKLSDADLTIKSKLPETKVIARLDGRRTYRIFENILSNIAKYSMRGTRVYIDCEFNSSEHEFTCIFKNISNHAMNFNPELLYERTYRGDKSRNTEGSGLGLGITKNLIELQGGSMDLDIDGDLFKVSLTFPTLESVATNEGTET